MIISQVLHKGYKILNNKKISTAHLDTELLLSFVIAKSREYILAHSDKILTAKQTEKFNDLIKQRAKHIPVAYLLKEKYFYGRKFYVDNRVLVPRPETEILIDLVKRITHNIKRQIIIDVGTGSGCIPITLALELNQNNIIATDISKDALVVTRKNARLHGVDKKIKFLQGNLLEPILKNKKLVINNSSLVICANLPYLTPTQVKNSPSIKHEPRLALVAGKDGLKYYKELFKQIKQLVETNPKLNITILCEIDPSQTKNFIKLLSSVIPAQAGIQNQIKIKKDLADLDRVMVIEM